MAIADSTGDLGIVLFLLGNPSGFTYIDRRGTVVNAETLTTSYLSMAGSEALKTSIMYQGAATAITFWCLVNLSMATSVSIKVQSLYGNDPNIDANWSDLQLVNQLTGATSNAFALNANGTYALQTASAYTVLALRVVAQAAGAGFTAADYVKVAARVGL